MEPLDLSSHPPRSPRERLDGLLFMPRTIDKMRAHLPGGNPGEYKIDGSSTRLLAMIGVDAQVLQTVVANASDEGEVAQWLREHADVSKYQEANDHFLNRSTDDIPPENRERFAKNYPHHHEAGSRKIIDILEHDDAVSFRDKAQR